MAKSAVFLSILLISLAKELLRLGWADKLFPEKNIAKHIGPLSPCVTRTGQDGVCLHKNHCPSSHFEKHSLQCFSPTGRRLVCCPHFHYRLPQEASDCGIKPKPDLLIPKDMVAQAIVGGEESVPLTWPWLSAIYEDQVFICGGALIGNRCVVTAAHCFESMNPDPSHFFVRLGEHSLSDDAVAEYPEEYMADKITLHPKYREEHSDYDLAIIHLNEAARETPICLPRPSHRHTDLVNRTSVVAGWGTKVFDPNFRAPFSSVLQEVTIPILHANFCHSHYKEVPSFQKAFVEGVDRKYLCAGQVSGGKDACQGDSGGPLMAELEPNRWSLIGIVCIGFGCGLKGYPGIYTKVTHFQAWIEKTCGKR